MVRSRRFVWLLCPSLLVLSLACSDGPASGSDRPTASAPPATNPLAPARSPVVGAPDAGGSEALGSRELDPFSLPSEYHAASGPLTPSTTTLPVDETYGGNAGFAFRITQEGSGNGGWFRIRSPSSVNRMALLATHTGEGIAARAINTGTGRAFWAQIPEPSNPFPALVATHVGSGEAIEAISFGNGPAIMGRGEGTAQAGVFRIDNPSNNGDALQVFTNGNIGSDAIFAQSNGGSAGIFFMSSSTSDAPALFASTSGTDDSDAIIGQTNGLGSAGTFLIANSSNTASVLNVRHAGTGDLARFVGPGFDTRARITSAGDIVIDGSFIDTGADLAEAFDTESDPSGYGPGDVLAISTRRDRAVVKSGEAYSTRVIGVYATKPGILLGQESVSGPSGERIPVAVTGVVPTKVTAHNGAIARGAILVSSNRAGYAMRGEPVMLQGREIYPSGAIIGKALEPFAGPGAGTILVMVNVK